MARKINLTWTQPPEQRLAPRAQRHRHAARRNLKRGPVCVISVVSAGSYLYRKIRKDPWTNSYHRRNNLLHYAFAAYWQYNSPYADNYGGSYLHKVRPNWPSAFDVWDDNSDEFHNTMYPFPNDTVGRNTYGNSEYEPWDETRPSHSGFSYFSDVVVHNTGIPYWQDDDTFTSEWATFRSKFKDESITDRDVSQVPVYALWNKHHTPEETYAQYDWPSIEGVFLKLTENYIALWDRWWSGSDATYDNFIMGTNKKLIKRTKHTLWSPSFEPDFNTINDKSVAAQMDYYKISSAKWTHLEYSFNPPLITSGEEESGQAWGDSYNAWDAEVFPQYIKPDGDTVWNSWGSYLSESYEVQPETWAEAGLAKPVLDETVSDWFALCGFTGDQGAAAEKGNAIGKVLLYIEHNDNETINGEAYKLFKEKATNAGLIVKCLTRYDEAADEYGYTGGHRGLGLGVIHKALNVGLFHGTEEGFMEALDSGDLDQYIEDNTKLSPGLGFDEFGTRDAAYNKIAEEGDSLWLDYPSQPDTPTHSSNRWFRTEAEAADH